MLKKWISAHNLQVMKYIIVLNLIGLGDRYALFVTGIDSGGHIRLNVESKQNQILKSIAYLLFYHLSPQVYGAVE